MAIETDDWHVARVLLNEAKVSGCCIAPPDAPAWMHTADAVPYLCLGLPATPAEAPEMRVYTSGWPTTEGVMVLDPNEAFTADMRAGLAVRSERALRDLLGAVPRGMTVLFYYAEAWILDVLKELCVGQELPAREGYFCTPQAFTPDTRQPVLHLGPADHDVLRDHWSPAVWEEVTAEGYEVFACVKGDTVEAFCFSWPVETGRREVHGLQAVRNWDAGYGESAFSAATADVLARGDVATCTVVLAGADPEAEVPLRLGYRPFYRVREFVGVKRGSGTFAPTTVDAFFQWPDDPPPRRPLGPQVPPVDIAVVRELAEARGRRRHGLFTAEGLLLAERALNDGLAIESMLYTAELERHPEGLALLHAAWRAGVPHAQISTGGMGTLTATRPLPPVLTIIAAHLQDVERLPLHAGSLLMVAEALQNPDNLGMLIRTADAMGADAVVVAGGGADPMHRQSVRAARGAVGRLPLRFCQDLPAWLDRLGGEGVEVWGATPQGSAAAFALAGQPPLALVVGNETHGLHECTLAACNAWVQIPMAPGQDSLNVAVAAGMLLYEAVRGRLTRGASV